MDTVAIAALPSGLPGPMLAPAAVVFHGFELDDEQCLPFEVFDVLADLGVDCTALSLSSTRRGNLYRTYRLMAGV
jgi:hypothetical protein